MVSIQDERRKPYQSEISEIKDSDIKELCEYLGKNSEEKLNQNLTNLEYVKHIIIEAITYIPKEFSQPKKDDIVKGLKSKLKKVDDLLELAISLNSLHNISEETLFPYKKNEERLINEEISRNLSLNLLLLNVNVSEYASLDDNNERITYCSPAQNIYLFNLTKNLEVLKGAISESINSLSYKQKNKPDLTIFYSLILHLFYAMTLKKPVIIPSKSQESASYYSIVKNSDGVLIENIDDSFRKYITKVLKICSLPDTFSQESDLAGFIKKNRSLKPKYFPYGNWI